MSDSLRRSVSQHYHHQRTGQHSRCSLGRSSSFKMMQSSRRPVISMCDCCGQSHERAGNHLYDYPLEISDDLMCQICLQPLVDAVDTPCGHTFCFVCIRKQIRRHRACPIDRMYLCESDMYQASILVRKMLDKLSVVCPNTAYCDATMPRSSLERHLKHMCPGTYIRCPRRQLGCDFVGPRNQLTDHLWECDYGNDIDPLTGLKMDVVENVLCLVEIPKGRGDLGLHVTQCERTGALVIQDIYPHGSAYRDNRLQPGDTIVEIDSQDFSCKSIAQARLALSSTQPLIAITVFRSSRAKESRIDEFDISQLEEIELVKDEDHSLGIQIHTSRNYPGIFVRKLERGSLAEENGRLLVGDRILEANGYDVRNANIDEAATRMAQAVGFVRLLVAHRHSPRSSQMRACSRSPPSGRSSGQRVYEELKTRTGFCIGALKCVILKKKPDESFGMSVSGGIGSSDGDIPIYVSGIRPEGVVDKSREIQRGDILLSVCDISLIDKTHAEAVQIIKGVSSASQIRLEMIQGEEIVSSAEDRNSCLSPDWERWMENYRTGRSSPMEMMITLYRNDKESLGFSLVGGVDSPKGDSPIFIKGIAPKSVAADDGRLKSRDQLVRVNDYPVVGMTQEDVVQMIKAISGDITLTVIPHHMTRV